MQLCFPLTHPRILFSPHDAHTLLTWLRFPLTIVFLLWGLSAAHPIHISVCKPTARFSAARRDRAGGLFCRGNFLRPAAFSLSRPASDPRSKRCARRIPIEIARVTFPYGTRPRARARKWSADFDLGSRADSPAGCGGRNQTRAGRRGANSVPIPHPAHRTWP